MSSVYPGGLDSFATNRADATPMVTTHPADHNNYADAINKIEATLGVDPQGIFSTVAARLLNISSPILMSSTNISSAQLLALDATGVELLPAPGGRFYYVIFGFVFHYRFVTTPYNETVTNSLIVGLADDLTELADTGFMFAPLGINAGVGSLLKKTEDFYVSMPVTTAEATLVGNYILPASDIENKPLLIGILFAGPLTGGDSTLTVRTFYSLIDGAP